jgi:hypothetical protein
MKRLTSVVMIQELASSPGHPRDLIGEVARTTRNVQMDTVQMVKPAGGG